MDTPLRIHLVAGALMVLLIGVISLLWAYPIMLVLGLLVIVAALAYGALYLIVAAHMDPESNSFTEPVPDPNDESKSPSPRAQAPSAPPRDLENFPPEPHQPGTERFPKRRAP